MVKLSFLLLCMLSMFEMYKLLFGVFMKQVESTGPAEILRSAPNQAQQFVGLGCMEERRNQSVIDARRFATVGAAC